MTVDTELIPNGTVTSPRGFTAGAVFAGVNKYAKHKLDLGILLSEAPCTTAGLFTTNEMKAAPVLLCQAKLPGSSIRAVVVNSGCANAGTGEQGRADATVMTQVAAETIGVDPQDVLIASTGVIGKRLPLDSIRAAIKKIRLAPEGGNALAKAIMTTDTTTKEVAIRAGGNGFIIGGIAKGSGMIHPMLGTLLCFLTTDANLDKGFLSTALKQAVDVSFNMVSIDGDTSPNDTVLLMANGLAGNRPITQGAAQADAFQKALEYACIQLARVIARDGEGAGKLIEVKVRGAADTDDARSAARAIVGSPLVKAAVHGNDPNWGRIVAAVGRSGAELVESKLDLYIGGICLIKEGSSLPFNMNDVTAILKKNEVSIDLNLNLGEATATAWGCDLSEEYVTINSQYTT